MKIVFIIGLPGSGKTYFAKSLVSPNTLVMDDFNKDDLACLPEDNEYNTLVIIDPNFCISDIFKDAVAFL